MTHHDEHRPLDRDTALKKLHELIEDVEVAMLTEVAPDGRLHSRPLHTLRAELDGTLWFATGYDSEKVRELEANPQVNVAYASRGKGIYVSVAGRASVTRDRATIDALWSPQMSVFFKGGKDDPNLCLIRIDPESAEYWDGPGTALGKGLYFVTTAVTKNPGHMNDNRTIDLRH
jgi:general stress protein 26